MQTVSRAQLYLKYSYLTILGLRKPLKEKHELEMVNAISQKQYLNIHLLTFNHLLQALYVPDSIFQRKRPSKRTIEAITNIKYNNHFYGFGAKIFVMMMQYKFVCLSARKVESSTMFIHRMYYNLKLKVKGKR